MTTRHARLVDALNAALSDGAIVDWELTKRRGGWQWSIETPEGPCCLTFKRGLFTTRQAEIVLQKIAECRARQEVA